jgi:hypothetical protein
VRKVKFHFHATQKQKLTIIMCESALTYELRNRDISAMGCTAPVLFPAMPGFSLGSSKTSSETLPVSDISPELKRRFSEGGLSLPSRAEVKKIDAITPVPTYLCGVILIN